jgi:hypothetical protein
MSLVLNRFSRFLFVLARPLGQGDYQNAFHCVKTNLTVNTAAKSAASKRESSCALLVLPV